MADALKDQYGLEIPRKIAKMIKAVHPKFSDQEFLKTASKNYLKLNLMQRGHALAAALKQHLPNDFERATAILSKSLGPRLDQTESTGMSSFLYMPHIFFCSTYGLEHFDTAMQLQYELTQRFTAEFSIRKFIIADQDRTLKLLKKWAKDPSEHVRRLVSEGIRPRLPWAERLRKFQQDPRPVIELLNLLKDDSSLYVRRSVANCLNDISKDNPEIFYQTIKSWSKPNCAKRTWLINHALRTAIKRGEPEALKVLGYDKKPQLQITKISITPSTIKIGANCQITVNLKNKLSKAQEILIDLKINYVKANGRSNPKVFKLTKIKLDPLSTSIISKKISFKQLTTRKHYPGCHRFDLIINGCAFKLGELNLTK